MIQCIGIEFWINKHTHENRSFEFFWKYFQKFYKIIWIFWQASTTVISLNLSNTNFCCWAEPRILMFIEVHFVFKKIISHTFTYHRNCALNLFYKNWGSWTIMKWSHNSHVCKEKWIDVYYWWPHLYTFVHFIW